MIQNALEGMDLPGYFFCAWFVCGMWFTDGLCVICVWCVYGLRVICVWCVVCGWFAGVCLCVIL